jgi:hypothetical protein
MSLLSLVVGAFALTGAASPAESKGKLSALKRQKILELSLCPVSRQLNEKARNNVRESKQHCVTKSMILFLLTDMKMNSV